MGCLLKAFEATCDAYRGNWCMVIGVGSNILAFASSSGFLSRAQSQVKAWLSPDSSAGVPSWRVVIVVSGWMGLKMGEPALSW